MKKSNIYLFMLLITTGVGVWWLSSNSSSLDLEKTQKKMATATSSTSLEEFVSKDYAKIAKNLKNENVSGEEWKMVNNYALPAEKIVTSENAKLFFKVTSANMADIYSCLKKDFCGMTTRGEDDAYFDDKGTPAHILLNRSLKIMKESLRKDESLKKLIDWDLIQDLARSNSEALSVEALDILREFDSESHQTDKLIKITESYNGVAKADALIALSKNSSIKDKILLANEIEDVFSGADNNTVISVLEKLDKMKFSKVEIPKILRNLCRYKNLPDEEANWKMIRYQATKIYADFEMTCN
jgi:hypothetical protein